MATRRESRRLAVNILYQADVTARPPLEVVEERRSVGERIPAFTAELVEGVVQHLAQIDGLLGRYAEEWTVDRMPPLDRALLRVACHEILHREDVATGVAISEAVATAQELSTEDSGRFVNGVLGRIAREHADAG